jgi:hypothetical protein
MLVWNDSPPGFDDVVYAEPSGYCCTPLYWIFSQGGGFVVGGRWAMQHTPISTARSSPHWMMPKLPEIKLLPCLR